jgi:hypothetical protein
MRLLFSVLIAAIFGLIIRLLYGIFDGQLAVMSITFFFFVPYLIGYITILLIPYKENQSATGAFLKPSLSCLLTLVVTILFRIEGAICWLMAFPIFAVLAGVGGLIAFNRKKRRAKKQEIFDFEKDDWESPGGLQVSFLFLIPIFTGLLEGDRISSYKELSVTRQVEINASPAVVWASLVKNNQPVFPHRASFFNLLGFPHHLNTTLDTPIIGGCRLATYEKGLVFAETIRQIKPGQSMTVEIQTDPTEISKAIMDEHIVIGGKHIKMKKDEYTLTPLANGKTLLTLSSHFNINTPFNWYAGIWSGLLMSDILKDELNSVQELTYSR